jgi:RNA polymerase sigma factor (sigma-70 family)
MTFCKQQEYIKSALNRFTKDKWLIDELCQIVNIKLHTSKSKDKTKGLIYTAVKSVYIDHYRHTKSQRANSIVYEEWDAESENRPDDVLINKENKNLLLKSIEKLPPKQKEVVHLRYYYNLNYLEISKIMKCPKNTALSYMHDAKKNLKILLTKNQQL